MGYSHLVNMKTKILIAALAASLSLASCDRFLIDDIQTPPHPREDIILTKAQADIIPATREFTFDLVRNICTPDSKNIILSPFSLQTTLAMASVGADGDTRDEINTAIGFDKFSTDDVCSLYSTLIPALLKVDNTVDVSIANSVWVTPMLKIKPDYSKLLEKSFKGSAHTLSGSDDISSWVKKATRGTIKKLDVDVDGAMIILLNALYFKGMWADVFQKGDNREDIFTNYDGERKPVMFMYKESYMDYYYGETASAVNLLYGNGAYRMTVVIPTDENSTIDDVLEALNEDLWAQMAKPEKRGKVRLYMPKFECSYTAKLIPTLKQLGIRKAFTNEAEFTKMVNADDNLRTLLAENPLRITDAAQNSTIKVDEKGTEVISITELVFGVTMAGPDRDAFIFKVDTPFFYAISEVSTGTILFAGVQKWM